MKGLSARMKGLLQRCLRTAPPVPAPEEPPKSSYQVRMENELKFFDDYTDVHDLPGIFHYWSNKHLAPPKFHPFGITDPEQFYELYVQKYHQRFPRRPLRIVSLGCGNCDMEARLARRLREIGISDFRIDCLDINETMLARGRRHAADMGVEGHIVPLCADFNHWRPRDEYDVVIANQCLHHVVELENLFGAIKSCLRDEGCLLTSDMIGRNGHQRWPEALAMVQEFWRELPENYRYNRLLRRHEPEYINHDCSTEGFEGIRAQDILPLLIENFHFELFIPFSNVVMVFIDRAFGHNFDHCGEWDRDFIDRVHAADERAMLDGRIKPTQMLAVLRKVPVETQLSSPILTPEFCVRVPD